MGVRGRSELLCERHSVGKGIPTGKGWSPWTLWELRATVCAKPAQWGTVRMMATSPQRSGRGSEIRHVEQNPILNF